MLKKQETGCFLLFLFMPVYGAASQKKTAFLQDQIKTTIQLWEEVIKKQRKEKPLKDLLATQDLQGQ